MWSREAIALLDEYYLPCGECAFCSSKDKRHRLWDMFMDYADNGYTPRKIQQDYPQESIEHIKLVLQIRPYRRGGSLDKWR